MNLAEMVEQLEKQMAGMFAPCRIDRQVAKATQPFELSPLDAALHALNQDFAQRAKQGVGR